MICTPNELSQSLGVQVREFVVLLSQPSDFHPFANWRSHRTIS
jgi:hypothetical protein